MRIAGYDTHPVADVHRLLVDAELEALARDVGAHGLRDPIWLVDVDGRELVLDGRNRLRACEIAGVDPRFSHYDGPTDLDALLAFSHSLNEVRRHDDVNQRAIAAARAEPLYAAAARERMLRGSGDPEATLPQGRAPQARDEAAAAYGVSGRTVQSAKKVLERGVSAVVEALERGGLPVHKAAQIATLERELQNEVLRSVLERGGTVGQHIKLLKRERLRVELKAAPPRLVIGRFATIVADPPWLYETRENDPTQRASTPYPPMATEAICALDVASRAEEHAVLWLWTTNQHVDEAFDVCRAWGFEQKAILTWVKPRISAGRWLRGRTEQCLLCVRGSPSWWANTTRDTVIEGPVREHSRKPESFYELVEELCPVHKIELFARAPRGPDWRMWGAETTKFAQGAVL